MQKIGKKLAVFLALLSIGFAAQAKQEISLATWNMEWLVSKGSKRFEPSMRDKNDIEKMASYFKDLDVSIFAFQEVGDVEVLKQVVGKDYEILFSDRSLKKNAPLQFDGLNQYTGFAIKKSIDIKDVEDISLLPKGRNDKLRFASYLILTPKNATPVHLLNVHLKAGCAGRYNKSNNCSTLKVQAEAINEWIKSREQKGESYIISGDFNHNLAYKKDWLWQDISESNKAVLASREMASKCRVRNKQDSKKTRQFSFSVDHVITSADIKINSIKQQLFDIKDVLDYQLSDHCPISAKLELAK